MRKMKQQILPSLLCHQTGSITVQFIFAFLLVFGFIIVFFYFSLTLVISELVQYATYSSSRYLSLSHVDVLRQKEVSKIKYRQLLFASPGSGGIFRNNFFGAINADKPFNLQPDLDQGVNQDMPGMQLGDRNLFYGVWTTFQPKGLSLKVPFWGETVEGAQPGLFDSVIGSYLGREPSQEECKAFAADRWRMIKQKINPNPSPHGGFNGSGGLPTYTYGGAPVNPTPDKNGVDNGC